MVIVLFQFLYCFFSLLLFCACDSIKIFYILQLKQQQKRIQPSVLIPISFSIEQLSINTIWLEVIWNCYVFLFSSCTVAKRCFSISNFKYIWRRKRSCMVTKVKTTFTLHCWLVGLFCLSNRSWNHLVNCMAFFYLSFFSLLLSKWKIIKV